MIIDGLLLLTGTSNGATATIAGSAYTDSPTTGTQASSNVIDLGVTSGVPASASGGGARDIGVGDDPSMKITAIVTTAFTGGTSLQLQVQGAPDNGVGGQGAYTTMWTSPVFAEASLVAGAQLANIDFPRVIFGQVLPRFIKLNFISVGSHGAGAIEASVVIDRDDQIMGTGGAYSGYVPGITVAN